MRKLAGLVLGASLVWAMWPASTALAAAYPASHRDHVSMSSPRLAGEPVHILFRGALKPFIAGTGSVQTVHAMVRTAQGRPAVSTRVQWTSSNPAVVQVQRETSTNRLGETTVRLIAGSAGGTAVITAVSGKASAKLHVAATAAGALLARWGIGSNTATTGAPQAAILPNQATSAAGWWADASPSLTVQALNNNGTMDDLAPNQSIILDAVWTNPDASAATGLSQPIWTVDSPDAAVTNPVGSYSYEDMPVPAPDGTVLSQGMAFSASQPGVYVIQANWDGTASVPLVILYDSGMTSM